MTADGDKSLRLVRYWPKDGGVGASINAFVEDWESDQGVARFTIARDHPLARQLWVKCVEADTRLMVYSTDEIEWMVDSISGALSYRHYEVRLVSRSRYLRKSLISDDYLVWLWLDAEKRWRKEK